MGLFEKIHHSLEKHNYVSRWFTSEPMTKSLSEKLNIPIERPDAPYDHIQIERMCKVISGCKDIKYDNWTSLNLKDRATSLNSLEEKIAEIEYHPTCHIKLTPLLKRPMGGYNTVTKDITINILLLSFLIIILIVKSFTP